jgi:high-affinity nickel permease
MVLGAAGGWAWGVIATAFTFGLRHGADWDHIAAISDITGTLKDRKRSMVLALVYALGHAFVILILGLLAVNFGELIPDSVATVMTPIVGGTLLALGIYLLYSLVREGRNFRYRSRVAMVYQGLMRMRLRFRRMQTVDLEHEHPHDHAAGHAHEHPEAVPVDELSRPVATAVQHSHPHVHRGALPAEDYGSRVTFVIGMFHGIGAETPTQVVLLLTAAGIGSRVTGTAVLLAFIAGLLVTNTLIAAVASLGYLRAGKNFALYASLGVVAAVFSIVLGTLILIGSDETLPTLFG